MLSSDELAQFENLLKPLKEGQERIEKTQHEQGTVIAHIKTDMQTVKKVVTHISTALEALAAGQQDIKEKMATKADVQDVKAEQGKLKRRIENVEEHTKTPNPQKN